MHSDEEEEIMDIDDPRVPEILRAHGRRFRPPAKVVMYLGNGEYVLETDDGEALDLVCLELGDRPWWRGRNWAGRQ